MVHLHRAAVIWNRGSFFNVLYFLIIIKGVSDRISIDESFQMLKRKTKGLK